MDNKIKKKMLKSLVRFNAFGPYGVIRHPMYAGVLLMFFFIPFALDSYFVMLAIFPIIPFIW